MIKKMLSLITFLSFATISLAQQVAQQQTSPVIQIDTILEEQELSGKLVHKPWTKSIQSYCAQGSGYYVLEVGGKDHVLALGKKMLNSLARKTGSQVSLLGEFETRVIPHPKNEMSQHPASSMNEEGDTEFTCTVFRATKVLK